MPTTTSTSDPTHSGPLRVYSDVWFLLCVCMRAASRGVACVYVNLAPAIKIGNRNEPKASNAYVCQLTHSILSIKSLEAAAGKRYNAQESQIRATQSPSTHFPYLSFFVSIVYIFYVSLLICPKRVSTQTLSAAWISSASLSSHSLAPTDLHTTHNAELYKYIDIIQYAFILCAFALCALCMSISLFPIFPIFPLFLAGVSHFGLW